MKTFRIRLVLTVLLLLHGAGMGQEEAKVDLAKELQNPVADLITLPISNSFDFGMGSADAMRFTFSMQPVYPISISKDFNVITRTILSYIDQEATAAGGAHLSGLGDSNSSFFVSPKEPFYGWVLGMGPIFQFPTATDGDLGSKKWGVGPTAVALRQEGAWTYGFLFNHVWSFAGDDQRSKVNATLVYPKVSYTTTKEWTLTVQAESTYDWEESQWTIPAEVELAKLLTFGEQPAEFAIAVHNFVDRPADEADWGIGFNVTFIFPK